MVTAKFNTLLEILNIWASISIMGSSTGDGIGTASLVHVIRVVMSTRSIGLPSSNTVHWLGTALGGALLVGVGIWAAKSIVGSNSADDIDSASPVLVVLVVMEASSISAPVSCTVNWLAASLSDALHLALLVRTLLAIQVSICGNLIGSATLILVANSNMLASVIV